MQRQTDLRPHGARRQPLGRHPATALEYFEFQLSIFLSFQRQTDLRPHDARRQPLGRQLATAQ